jgi:hypothetical protein
MSVAAKHARGARLRGAMPVFSITWHCRVRRPVWPIGSQTV